MTVLSSENVAEARRLAGKAEEYADKAVDADAFLRHAILLLSRAVGILADECEMFKRATNEQ